MDERYRNNVAMRGTEPAKRLGEMKTDTLITLPVARVLPLLQLPHLDREFDYEVPAEFSLSAQPGVRVRVRFAGRLVDGLVMDRVHSSEHDSRLVSLHRVVSPEPVLTSELKTLVSLVAARYAGTRSEILRLAIPPRHARAESEVDSRSERVPISELPSREAWSCYEHGAAYVTALVEDRNPRGVWSALPGEAWAERMAELAAISAFRGRTSILIAPDAREVRALAQACRDILGKEAVAVITAQSGPSVRYQQWLSARRGKIWCVVGTRAAIFAPVSDLGLVAVWNDSDENHHEQRAPYYHAREVAIVRAQATGSALLIAGHTVTPQGQLLVSSGWAHKIFADRSVVRERAPRVTVAGESVVELDRDPLARQARLPGSGFAVARASLHEGAPVLVQTPRKGYLSGLSCAHCRAAARCRYCHGPLKVAHEGGMSCGWCARREENFLCIACGHTRVRAAIKGAERTAEEFGRAFPGVKVHSSSGDRIIEEIPYAPLVVVATPGAEPRVRFSSDPVQQGYGAAIFLDSWQLLERPQLRAMEFAAQRWFAAAALVRPAHRGGRVIITADAGSAAVEALVRWDPWWFAHKELADREELGFTPAVRMAAVEGEATAVERFCSVLVMPTSVEKLGPVEIGDQDGTALVRVLLRVPRHHGAELSHALRQARSQVSVKSDGEIVRVRVDPADIG